MLFSNYFIDQTALQISQKSGFLGAGVDLGIALVSDNFTPDPSLQLTDFTQLTGNGLDPISCATGNALLIWDAETATWGFALNEPVAGLNFICSALADPPQVATGFIMFNADTGKLFSMSRFTSPITFDHIGKAILLSNLVGVLAGPFIGDSGVYETPQLSASPPTI